MLPAGRCGIAAVASAALTFVSGGRRRARAGAAGDPSERRGGRAGARGLGLLVAGDVELAVVDEYDYVPLALPEFVVAHPLCAEQLVLVVPRRLGRPDAGPRSPSSPTSSG